MLAYLVSMMEREVCHHHCFPRGSFLLSVVANPERGAGGVQQDCVPAADLAFLTPLTWFHMSLVCMVTVVILATVINRRNPKPRSTTYSLRSSVAKLALSCIFKQPRALLCDCLMLA